METTNLEYNIPQDVIELILSYLPIPSLIRASSVCKPWNAIIHSHFFQTSNSTRSPWLFILGQNNDFNEKGQLFVFDPESNYWILKLPSRILLSRSPFATANGLATSQTRFVRYCHISSMIGCMEMIELCLIAEVYNPSTDVWEGIIYDPLPEVFGSEESPKLLSWTLSRGKFYVLGIYSGFISTFDLEKRSWSNVRTLRPPGVMFSHLTSCYNGLVLAGLCRVRDEWGFNLWSIDEKTFEFREIGIMPGDLLSGYFDSAREEKYGLIKCVGSCNLVYVFDEECPWNYPVCVCEIGVSGKCCSWRRVPDLPEPVVKWPKVNSFCSDVSLLEVFRKTKCYK